MDRDYIRLLFKRNDLVQLWAATVELYSVQQRALSRHFILPSFILLYSLRMRVGQSQTTVEYHDHDHCDKAISSNLLLTALLYMALAPSTAVFLVEIVPPSVELVIWCSINSQLFTVLACLHSWVRHHLNRSTVNCLYEFSLFGFKMSSLSFSIFITMQIYDKFNS